MWDGMSFGNQCTGRTQLVSEALTKPYLDEIELWKRGIANRPELEGEDEEEVRQQSALDCTGVNDFCASAAPFRASRVHDSIGRLSSVHRPQLLSEALSGATRGGTSCREKPYRLPLERIFRSPIRCNVLSQRRCSS